MAAQAASSESDVGLSDGNLKKLLEDIRGSGNLREFLAKTHRENGPVLDEIKDTFTLDDMMILLVSEMKCEATLRAALPKAFGAHLEENLDVLLSCMSHATTMMHKPLLVVSIMAAAMTKFETSRLKPTEIDVPSLFQKEAEEDDGVQPLNTSRSFVAVDVDNKIANLVNGNNEVFTCVLLVCFENNLKQTSK